ncbi:hypothetical protein J2Z21_008811 [Streptomyces griseochromogenes]|uniref:Uncharacterized protein n=1 Tax=Streptomyces griseochromogenes TaxID=68214 RepID=A0ABS4M7Y8_9ACTN|nr:hypothetical protein [Streptomyces griseochromogenes]
MKTDGAVNAHWPLPIHTSLSMVIRMVAPSPRSKSQMPTLTRSGETLKWPLLHPCRSVARREDQVPPELLAGASTSANGAYRFPLVVILVRSFWPLAGVARAA